MKAKKASHWQQGDHAPRQSWEVSEGTKALRARVERMYPKQKHAWQRGGVKNFQKTGAMMRLSKRLGVHVSTLHSWCMGAKPNFELRWMLRDRFKIPMTAWTAKRFLQRRPWVDETGSRCGQITVEGVAPRRPNDHGMYFTCRCSCGAPMRISGTAIRWRRRFRPHAACIACNRARITSEARRKRT